MKLLILLTIIILLASCATQKRCERKFPPTESIDSIYIETIKEVFRDTIIYKELPPVYIETYTPVTDTLTLVATYSEAQCWVIDSTLFGNIREGTQPVRIEYKVKEVEVVKEIIVEKETIRDVRYIPFWSKILSGLGGVLILFIIFRAFFS